MEEMPHLSIAIIIILIIIILIIIINNSLTTSRGPCFDARFYHGNFSLQGKNPVVTMVWVLSRFWLKAPPGISFSCISPLTSSGRHSCASWASQPRKSARVSQHAAAMTMKVHKNLWWHWGN